MDRDRTINLKLGGNGTLSRRDLGDTTHEVVTLCLHWGFVMWFWKDHLGPWLWCLLKVIAGKDGAV